MKKSQKINAADLERFKSQIAQKVHILKCINPDCLKLTPAKEMFLVELSKGRIIIKYIEDKVCCDIFQEILNKALSNIA